jgi:hypothetical protein
MSKIIDVLFGCPHSDHSWPRGRGRYKSCSCLECGREFAYDWQRMKVLSLKQSHLVAAPKEAVTQ